MLNTMAHEARIGTTVEIMCVGHVVRAKIVGIKQTYQGSPAGDPALYEYECEFICHAASGASRLCLDFGQNWYIEAGQIFTAGEVQIAHAAYWTSRVTG